jgi:hypothetical protein
MIAASAAKPFGSNADVKLSNIDYFLNLYLNLYFIMNEINFRATAPISMGKPSHVMKTHGFPYPSPPFGVFT